MKKTLKYGNLGYRLRLINIIFNFIFIVVIFIFKNDISYKGNFLTAFCVIQILGHLVFLENISKEKKLQQPIYNFSYVFSLLFYYIITAVFLFLTFKGISIHSISYIFIYSLTLLNFISTTVFSLRELFIRKIYTSSK